MVVSENAEARVFGLHSAAPRVACSVGLLGRRSRSVGLLRARRRNEGSQTPRG
jgi:hypothetical protein